MHTLDFFERNASNQPPTPAAATREDAHEEMALMQPIGGLIRYSVLLNNTWWSCVRYCRSQVARAVLRPAGTAIEAVLPASHH